MELKARNKTLWFLFCMCILFNYRIDYVMVIPLQLQCTAIINIDSPTLSQLHGSFS